MVTLRERFEAWHERTYGWLHRNRDTPDDEYADGTVRCRWEAWKAGHRAGRRSAPSPSGGQA